MLQTLPTEIVQRIVQCMLTFPPPANEELDTLPSHGVYLQSWNKIHQRRHLFRLARTCKYLKSVVDPILYENWACHEKLSLATVKGPDDTRMHGFNIGLEKEIKINGKNVNYFRNWYFISKPVIYSGSDGKKSRNKSYEYDPKFYLVAGYQDIPESALKYVKHLGLVCNGYNEPHSLHLSKILPKMTSLTQVTLHLRVVTIQDGERLNHPLSLQFVLDFASIINLLLKREGKPLRINLFLRTSIHMPMGFWMFFRMFDTEWKEWTKLNIHTLVVDTDLPYSTVPSPFADPKSTLKGLKVFYMNNQVLYDTSRGEIVEGGRGPDGNCVVASKHKRVFY